VNSPLDPLKSEKQKPSPSKIFGARASHAVAVTPDGHHPWEGPYERSRPIISSSAKRGIRSKRRPDNHLYLIAEAAGIGLRFQEGQNHFAFLNYQPRESAETDISLRLALALALKYQSVKARSLFAVGSALSPV